MRDPLDADVATVPSVGRHQLVSVDGRTFAISGEDGEMVAPTHGVVHDDRRHLSRFRREISAATVAVLSSSAVTPLSGVVVLQVTSSGTQPRRALLIQRRWLADGLREDIEINNPSPEPQQWTVRVWLAADFAHVFDVKAGISGVHNPVAVAGEGWAIRSATHPDVESRVAVAPRPDEFDADEGAFTWHVRVEPRGETTITLTLEPVVDGEPAGLAFPCGTVPHEAVPLRRLEAWRSSVPTVVSTDPRLARSFDQSMADLAALRIFDTGHLDRTVIAAGAPWFMTLFGRDSLLTAWMTLPFEPTLAVGVLHALADLQGHAYDTVAEEQPGKILHELRRQGGGGPFASRARYYGTVDATPLFVMLAGEAARWGALSADDVRQLAPAIDAALGWILADGDSNGDGFVDYQRSAPSGLTNQGWKDSWDGVTFADGTLPEGPIALAEVQGYTYAALLAACDLVRRMGLKRDPLDLEKRALTLRERFNEQFWDPQGWFAIGLDGAGRRIDSLTTNPGHALWSGIADTEHAHAYLDRIKLPDMWTGWGLRTLSARMYAFDPLSYHTGSVWPHDTAICAAGAARYGRWDVVDMIVDGALDAAIAFDGRPPELFAGISRRRAPRPVAYPSSCSPQAWASASILLLLRALLDIGPAADGTSVEVGRIDLVTVPDLTIERMTVGPNLVTLRVEAGDHLVVAG